MVALEPSLRAQVLDAAVSATLIGGQAACTQRRISLLLDASELASGGPLASGC